MDDVFCGLELDELGFGGFETVKGPQINLLKLGLEATGDCSGALLFEVIVADFVEFGRSLGVVHEDFHEGERLEFESDHGEFFGKECFLGLGHWEVKFRYWLGEFSIL